MEAFQVLRSSGQALGPRLGLLRTAHGEIETPAFLPVATQATVKALSPQDLREVGCQAFIANTYHLLLRPGIEAIERLGGLHGFMAWEGPIATDSGGFQVASLAQNVRLSDEAITFRSHLDGALLHLSPEGAIQVQERLGSDLLMCLDQPSSFGGEENEVREATERTHAWAVRCLRAHRGPGLLYGIVQGGTFPELREGSACTMGLLPFDGFAIGGLSLGEPKETMWRMVEVTVPLLPPHRPRHLLGVGSPEDLLEGVARGIDTFDCALPTRAARNGGLYTPQGRVDITTARFREEAGPVQPDCDCATCRTYSAAYLHHLFKAQELLASRLASIHNLRFVVRLLEGAREGIRTGTFAQFVERFLAGYRPADAVARENQRRRGWGGRQGRRAGMATHAEAD
ncbi:MAG: tRNA guanosine(34) transglycosylase Tgt [Chloroflexi bacterium]|nr:tRNA guanosine(34) transglycosylase Tgt [Chloroflexota bacterium]